MAAIAGIGAFFPEEVRTNDAWPSDFGERARRSSQRILNDIPLSEDPALRVTEEFLAQEAQDPFMGVRERRIAPDSMTAVDAEVAAAKLALEDAQISPREIDCVISYSAVPDRPTPPAACAVADRLGVGPALSWGLDAACASAMVQIATARALIDAGQAKNVLLTQSHLMLRTFPLMHPASPCVGDASTALVVSARGRWPILATHAVTHGEHHCSITWVRESAPATLDPADTPWWKGAGDFRVGSLNVAGAKVLQRDTVALGAQTLRELAAKAGIDLERLSLVASGEPRGWIPRGYLRVLGLDESLLESVYETKGHLGGCGCVANLEQAHRKGRTNQGGLAMMYAQGAGFTRAGVLLQLDAEPGGR